MEIIRALPRMRVVGLTSGAGAMGDVAMSSLLQEIAPKMGKNP
jgi:hypothetical protein